MSVLFYFNLFIIELAISIFHYLSQFVLFFFSVCSLLSQYILSQFFISFSVYLSIYLSIIFSSYLSITFSSYLSIYLSQFLYFFSQSIYLSQFFYFFLSLSIYLSIYHSFFIFSQSIYLSIYLSITISLFFFSVYLSITIFLFLSQFIYLSIYLNFFHFYLSIYKREYLKITKIIYSSTSIILERNSRPFQTHSFRFWHTDKSLFVCFFNLLLVNNLQILLKCFSLSNLLPHHLLA